MSNIRVISGKARGRKLQRVPGDSTRPITDRVKEALFNIIGSDLYEASFLDLFAGTGSVGIEALSRGVSFTRFVDNHPQAIRTIWNNLRITKLDAYAEVIKTDAFAHLKSKPDRLFDYIYIAPPQYKNIAQKALLAVDESIDWLALNGWVITQIDPKESFSVPLCNLDVFDRRKYGNTMLEFYINQA